MSTAWAIHWEQLPLGMQAEWGAVSGNPRVAEPALARRTERSGLAHACGLGAEGSTKDQW